MTTITEALAEIKTINKRILKKNEFVQQYLVRSEQMRDPLEKDGGSRVVIAQERQAIHDLEERWINIRTQIALANATNSLTIDGITRTIAEWLTWRREISPGQLGLLRGLSGGIQRVREEAHSRNLTIAASGTSEGDVIVNIDEKELAEMAEGMETILGQLDGLLSLKNAQIEINV